MATATRDDQRMTKDFASDGPPVSLDDRRDGPNGAISPTYHADVDVDESGESYAEISITCRFRDTSELLDWIVAASLRLADDINAQEATRVGCGEERELTGIGRI